MRWATSLALPAGTHLSPRPTLSPPGLRTRWGDEKTFPNRQVEGEQLPSSHFPSPQVYDAGKGLAGAVGEDPPAGGSPSLDPTRAIHLMLERPQEYLSAKAPGAKAHGHCVLQSVQGSRQVHGGQAQSMPDPAHLSPWDVTLLAPHKTAIVWGFLLPPAKCGLEVLLRP